MRVWQGHFSSEVLKMSMNTNDTLCQVGRRDGFWKGCFVEVLSPERLLSRVKCHQCGREGQGL